MTGLISAPTCGCNCAVCPLTPCPVPVGQSFLLSISGFGANPIALIASGCSWRGISNFGGQDWSISIFLHSAGCWAYVFQETLTPLDFIYIDPPGCFATPPADTLLTVSSVNCGAFSLVLTGGGLTFTITL